MAKFYGAVGYGITAESETKPGVWEKTIVEYNYYGDVLITRRTLSATENLNDDIKISNQISIVADPFATENFQFILYVKFMGARWKVSSVEISYPRLILTLGEVYNGPTS